MLKELFSGNGIRARFAKNTGWLLAQSVFQYMLTAVIGIIAARYLGPENYGVLGYGVSLMAIFQCFCTLGLNDIQIAQMIERPEERGAIVGTALALRMTSTALSIAGITLTAAVLRPGNPLLLLVTFLQSLQLLFEAFDAMRLWFQMELLSKYTAIGSVIGNIACSAWRVALLIQGAPVEWFALTSVVQMLTNYLFVVPLFFMKSGLRLRFSWPVTKRMLGKSWHFILSGLTGAASAHFGKLFLGGTLGDAPLGCYNAAVSISTMWLFVTLALVDSAMPVLLGTHKRDVEAYKARYRALLMAVLGVGLLAGVFLCAFAPFVIHLLYGEAFEPAVAVLRVVAWIGIFSNIGSARNIFTQAEGAQSTVKWISLIAAGTSVLLNLLLVPALGMMGAALACLAGYVVSGLVAPALVPGSRPYVKLYFSAFREVPALVGKVFHK